MCMRACVRACSFYVKRDRSPSIHRPSRRCSFTASVPVCVRACVSSCSCQGIAVIPPTASLASTGFHSRTADPPLSPNRRPPRHSYTKKTPTHTHSALAALTAARAAGTAHKQFGSTPGLHQKAMRPILVGASGPFARAAREAGRGGSSRCVVASCVVFAVASATASTG